MRKCGKIWQGPDDSMVHMHYVLDP